MKIQDKIATWLMSTEYQFEQWQASYNREQKARQEGYDEGYAMGKLKGQIIGYSAGSKDMKDSILFTSSTTSSLNPD